MKDKRKNRAKTLIIGLLILLVLLLFYLLLGKGDANYGVLEDNDKISLILDENSSEGDITGKSKNDIVMALNEKVQEGTIHISMNTNPVFADGKAKGTLMIRNRKVNRYPQQIEIYIKDTNELIYSGGVEVGHRIETSSLLVDLAKGDYDCVAYFHAVDLETDTRIGTAGADIKITILN